MMVIIVSCMSKCIGLAVKITDIFLSICVRNISVSPRCILFFAFVHGMDKQKHLECFLFYIHVFEVSHLRDPHLYRKVLS